MGISKQWCRPVAAVVTTVVVLLSWAGEGSASSARSPLQAFAALAHATTGVASNAESPGATSHDDIMVPCTYNGVTGPGILENVTPGEVVNIVCSGWPANDQLTATEVSPLLGGGDLDAIDPNYSFYTASPTGTLNVNFTIPNPFTAPDPTAVCPPTPDQVNAGYLRCGIEIVDLSNYGSLVALDYAAAPPPPPPPPPPKWTGMAATPDGKGYWLVNEVGAVHPHGDATSYGDLSARTLNAPINHIVSTPDGLGYWLVAADGGIFSFGDARFFGSTGNLTLNAPVVDMAPTRDGKGYWLVARDGGIFAFGDAPFHGSMGGRPLNQPIVGIAPDDVTNGYWLVARDGGIFSFGAPFFGSTGALRLNQPINGMAPTSNDHGYWFVASDGGIFCFGNAAFHGSMGGRSLAQPVMGMAADDATGGYWMVAADGGIFTFGAPFFGAG